MATRKSSRPIAPTIPFNPAPAPQRTKRTRNNTIPPPNNSKIPKTGKVRALKPVAAAVKSSAVYNTPSKKWCAAAFEKYVGLLPEGARPPIENRKEEFVKLFKRGSILQIDNLKNNNAKFKKEINLSDNKLLDLLVHMWLDGIHDSYINYNFRSFLSKNIKKNLNQVVYIFSADSIKPVITRIDDLARMGNIGPYFTEIFSFLDESVAIKIKKNIKAEPNEKLISFGTSWERTFKLALIKKYKIETTAGGIFNIKSPTLNNNIYLSIDQEFKSQGERSLTKLVNMLSKTRKSHVSYNIETIGTLLDPGTTMLQYGTQNILSFMRFNKNATDVDMFQTKFYFAPFHFIIKDLLGVTVSNVECKVNIFGELVVYSNGHELELPVTKGAAAKANIIVQLEKKLELATTIGTKLLTLTQEKARDAKIQKIQTDLKVATVGRKSGLNTSGVTEYSKYMGDALQYMILAASNPIRGITRGGPTVSSYGYTYFCSGDSMALIGYDIMCELCNNKEPRFIIDIAGAYSVEIAVSPQFEKDGFVIDFSKRVGGNMTVLTGETDGKMETDESSSVKYINLIKKIAGENRTLIKNINPVFKKILFGNINNQQLNVNLSKFNTTQLISLTNLVNINKLANFKSKFNEFKKSANKATVNKARRAKRPLQRAVVAALAGNAGMNMNQKEGGGNSDDVNMNTAKAAQNARNTATKAAANQTMSGSNSGATASTNSGNENNKNYQELLKDEEVSSKKPRL